MGSGGGGVCDRPGPYPTLVGSTGNGCDSLYGLGTGDGERVRTEAIDDTAVIASGTGGGGWFGGLVCGGEAVDRG